MKRVMQIVTVWQASDGSTAEFIEDGSEMDVIQRFANVRALPDPKRPVRMHLLLDDGTRTVLPFARSSTCILPDRTGIVSIFGSGEYRTADGTDYFPDPHNAAIFDADGSLRFQLRVPDSRMAHRIAAFHGGAMPKRWEGLLGLLIATHPEAPPEWVYAVDPQNPELIPTGQWVRY